MLKKERIARKRRMRAKVLGTGIKPRLSVYRSNTQMYAQLIDDKKGVTLVQARGDDAVKVGQEIAQKMVAKKIMNAVFDRSGYRYHGKVKALCDAVRAGGVKI